MTELDKITTWQASRFIDSPDYDHCGESWKKDCEANERKKIVSALHGNALVHCPSAEVAEWIAERLNLAAKLERFTSLWNCNRCGQKFTEDESRIVNVPDSEECVIDCPKCWANVLDDSDTLTPPVKP